MNKYCKWQIKDHRAIPGCQTNTIKYWGEVDTFRLCRFYESFSGAILCCPFCGREIDDGTYEKYTGKTSEKIHWDGREDE